MDKTQNTWKTWLEGVPVDQQKVLLEVLKANTANGKNTAVAQQEDDNVIITRTPTKDLMVVDVPTYVDIFNLHEAYKRLAFSDMNLILKGPKGDGKTLSVLSYAAQIGCPVVIQECSEETKRSDLMGTQTLLGDRTIFVLGSIPTTIEVANEVGMCILLFEEFNAFTPATQKQVNSVADFRQMVSLPHIKRVFRLKPGAKIWIVGTMNPSAYGGTYDMNEDLKSRFDEIELYYPEYGQEKFLLRTICANYLTKEHLEENGLLDQVLRFAKETRQPTLGYSLSTRDVARLIRSISLIGINNALQMVIGKFEDSDKDTVIKRILSTFDPKPTVKKFWGSL